MKVEVGREPYSMISKLLHPSVTSSIGLAWLSIGFHSPLIVIVEVLAIYGALPYLLVLQMKRLGLVSDIFVTKRRERPLLFVIAIAIYSIGPALMHFSGAPPIIFYLSICYLINMIIIAGLTLKVKVSLHTSSASGMATAIVYLLGAKFIGLLSLPIIVAISRIRVKEHTKLEVALGFIIAIALVALELYLYRL
ncbi:MAG: phosphatase PAP2 family protein [Caldisphaeraceae archaeon]|nr:phosphatase PAP2 family protein [Caldisphaeraceae archaeon]